MHSAIVQCTWATCSMQWKLGVIKHVCCVCKRGMCVGRCMHILNGSIHFTFIHSISLSLLTLQLRPWLYHFTLALSTTIPSLPPWFHISFAPGPLGKLVQISFHSVTPLLQGLTVDSHCSLKLTYSATPNLSNLFSCYSPLQPSNYVCLSTCTYVLLISMLALCLWIHPTSLC